MDETPNRLATKPSWLITQLAVHARRLVFEGFAEAGVRGYQYRILAALQEFGTANQTELARRCHMDRSDVVAAINDLATENCVERAPDPDDRRRNIVVITSVGRQQLRRIDRTLDAVQDKLVEPLSPDETRTLMALLERLLDHHNGHDQR